MNLTLAKRAADDIEAIHRHISRSSPRGAAKVAGAIEEAMEFIAAHPEACPFVLPGIRMKIVRAYRYKIFFASSSKGVEILHVRHPSRDPDWD